MAQSAMQSTVLLGVWASVLSSAAIAEPAPRGAFFSDRAPLIAAPNGPLVAARAPDPRQAATGASLFAGQGSGSFFAPWPDRKPMAQRARSKDPLVAHLLDLIASVEATEAEYDTIQLGARILPGKRPTDMTIAEIDAWIKDTPGQPHAIGRYQFIPPTLRRLVKKADVSYFATFTPAVQDQLAQILLEEAGLRALKTGQITRTAFMNNMAKIWAGLPNTSGKSHYDGYAGNKAVISWDRFEREMDALFAG